MARIDQLLAERKLFRERIRQQMENQTTTEEDSYEQFLVEVKNDKFMEYVDVEGLVQPILTIKVNTREAGSVDRIVGEEGNMMKQGDTLLILTNPDLIRSIEDQRDEWEKQRITYKEKEIEMEQK